MMTRLFCAVMLSTSVSPALAQSEDDGDVIRHPIPNSDFPILQAVEVPSGATQVYLSGTVPGVRDDTADPDSIEAYGNTQAQTVSVLGRIEKTLSSLDLTMGDVVKMQVYLVAPPDADSMDFSGFMNGYTQFFGSDAQPEVVTRSVFEVAGLANPNFLVEIEVMAVRPAD